MIIVAFGWPPSETDKLELDDLLFYGALAEQRLKMGTLSGVLK